MKKEPDNMVRDVVLAILATIAIVFLLCSCNTPEYDTVSSYSVDLPNTFYTEGEIYRHDGSVDYALVFVTQEEWKRGAKNWTPALAYDPIYDLNVVRIAKWPVRGNIIFGVNDE